MDVPLDDMWLGLYQDALAPCEAAVGEDGELSVTRPHGFGLQQVLDMAAGHDPERCTVIDAGDANDPDQWRGAEYVESDSPTYHVNDLVGALIAEVRRLRS